MTGVLHARLLALGVAVAFGGAASSAAGCADRTAGGEGTVATAAGPGTALVDRGIDPAVPAPVPVDEALLAFLAGARAYHLRADLLEEKGDLAGARAEMEALLAMRSPEGPAGRDAAQDAWARLARIDVADKPPRLDDAMRAVERGLAVSGDETYYRANLLLAKGEILEARGEGEPAMSAYEESIAINKKVLDRLMVDRGAK